MGDRIQTLSPLRRDTTDVEGFLASLKRTGRRRSTVAVCSAKLSAFLDWYDLRLIGPADAISTPRPALTIVERPVSLPHARSEGGGGYLSVNSMAVPDSSTSTVEHPALGLFKQDMVG